MKTWTKVADTLIQHVWKKAENDKCSEGPDTVVVSPDPYQANGTPLCWCGKDMVYSHTEILM